MQRTTRPRRLPARPGGVGARPGRQAGFSLIELLAALALTVTVLLMVGKNFIDSSRAYTGLSQLMFISTRAQVVMDRLVLELATASFTSLTPPVPVDSNTIEFQKIIGVLNGDPVLGNPWHIDLVPMESDIADNADNDGDGLIDESGLRIWEDLPPYGPTPDLTDLPAIISARVAGGGLKFTRVGSLLSIELTLQENIETGKPPRTVRVVSGVKMRNN